MSTEVKPRRSSDSSFHNFGATRERDRSPSELRVDLSGWENGNVIIVSLEVMLGMRLNM